MDMLLLRGQALCAVGLGELISMGTGTSLTRFATNEYYEKFLGTY